MNPSIEIRKAVLKDANRLAELSAQLGYPVETTPLSARLAKINDDPHQTTWVAEVEGRVVGWMHLFIAVRLEAEEFVEVGGLVIDEDWRGKGVGGLLMQQAEAWSAENGIRWIRLRSNVIRKEAHKFYEGLGYSHDKDQRVFSKRF